MSDSRWPLLRNRGYHFRFELGVPVDLTLLLGKSDAAAMWMGGLVTYSSGFEFIQIGVTRDWSAITTGSAGRPTIAIRFADGLESKMTGILFSPVPNPPPSWGMVRPIEGHFSESMWHYVWSVRPLPPPDGMTITASYEAADIPETTHTIDVSPILEAAALARPLWKTVGQ